MIGYIKINKLSKLELEDIEGLTDVPRRALWKYGYDTNDIARIKKVSEAVIYNDLATGWLRGEIHGQA